VILLCFFISLNQHHKALDGAGRHQALIDRDCQIIQPQKVVTTEAVNALGEKVKYRVCGEPFRYAAKIYRLLHYNDLTFMKKENL
jgi:hypothetical protein